MANEQSNPARDAGPGGNGKPPGSGAGSRPGARERGPTAPPCDLPTECSGRVRFAERRKSRRKLWCFLLPPAGLVVFASLFVGWDVAIRHLFPEMSTGLRHAMLTAWAAIVTAVTSTIVYVVAHRQHRRLSATAQQLARLIGNYRADLEEGHRFENPHLVHCGDVVDCEFPNCPMHASRGERCWQVMALRRSVLEDGVPQVEIDKCLNCKVYRKSCPDKLTELGESFNNMMFLLEEEARQVGRMRAQMLEKEKMVAVGQIAAGVAHEVGNPLSSISSIVQMLKRKGANAATAEEFDLIDTHIQRISGTVRELVSLARPADDRWVLIDVGQTLEEAVRLISFDRRARNIRIDFDRPTSLPKTFAVVGQLQQVFINLSLNALDAMPEGGTLSIKASQQNRKIAVRIEDTGCGIPPEIGRRVFEPFFTTKQAGRGTGLGLAVSYGIIQKHGGEIGIESEVGKGTAFIVEFPIVNKPPGNMA